MKKIILFVAMATHTINAQQLDHDMTDENELVFNYVQEIITLVVNAIDGAIQFFEGPNGCTSCTVQPLTAFTLDWGVQNVQGCTGSNTANHPSFDGALEPIGGGTGVFSTTIVGGLSFAPSPVVFTLNCPAVTLKNHQFYYLGQETSSLILPEKIYMMARVIKGNTFLINIVENESFDQSIIELNRKFKAIGNKQWYSELYVNNKADIDDVKASINHDQISKEYEYDKIWFVVTEVDPRSSETPTSYEIGKCDNLSIEPVINFSTHTILKAELLNECILEPDKTYFLTRVYLKKYAEE